LGWVLAAWLAALRLAWCSRWRGAPGLACWSERPRDGQRPGL